RTKFVYILTIMDACSRYAEALPMKDMRAETVVRALVRNIFCRYGIPKALVSDNGSQFIARIFIEMRKRLGIIHIFTSTYHPKSNSVERVHRELLAIIGKFCDEQHTLWEELLPYCMHAYRCTPHLTLGDTPFYYFYTRDPNLPLLHKFLTFDDETPF